MREKFTEEEWGLLKILPFHLFVMVAGADQDVDKAEIEALQNELRDAPVFKDPLHRALFLDIVMSDPMPYIKEAMNLGKLVERSMKVKGFLRKKLTEDEYQRFVGSMFIFGLNIARASGGGLFGRGNKISDEERMALAAFGSMFDLDVTSMSKYFS